MGKNDKNSPSGIYDSTWFQPVSQLKIEIHNYRLTVCKMDTNRKFRDGILASAEFDKQYTGLDIKGTYGLLARICNTPVNIDEIPLSLQRVYGFPIKKWEEIYIIVYKYFKESKAHLLYEVMGNPVWVAYIRKYIYEQRTSNHVSLVTTGDLVYKRDRELVFCDPDAVKIAVAVGYNPNAVIMEVVVQPSPFHHNGRVRWYITSQTLLHRAARWGDIGLLRAWIDAGADPNIKGKGGENALDQALTHRAPLDMILLLSKYCAITDDSLSIAMEKGGVYALDVLIKIMKKQYLSAKDEFKYTGGMIYGCLLKNRYTLAARLTKNHQNMDAFINTITTPVQRSRSNSLGGYDTWYVKVPTLAYFETMDKYMSIV